ncbi:hypothetical protein [Paenibacillus nanensis]|uniref:hypothetical protein n=1 Tax=Paenibacillus nanensis TaxID=393251 RepID=UPI0011C492EC|nr:hypothetical protein [Paenibacillus nanensis]
MRGAARLVSRLLRLTARWQGLGAACKPVFAAYCAGAGRGAACKPIFAACCAGGEAWCGAACKPIFAAYCAGGEAWRGL